MTTHHHCIVVYSDQLWWSLAKTHIQPPCIHSHKKDPYRYTKRCHSGMFDHHLLGDGLDHPLPSPCTSLIHWDCSNKKYPKSGNRHWPSQCPLPCAKPLPQLHRNLQCDASIHGPSAKL